MESKTKASLLLGLFLLVSFGSITSVMADTIDVTSGVVSTPVLGQSYNETRAVDVTVVSPQNLLISSITLSRVRIPVAGPSAIIGARIYDSNGSLLAAQNAQNVVGMLDYQSIQVPIEATLVTGQSYRISFVVTPGFNSSGDGVSPSQTPYFESSGNLRINSGWAIASDAYPTVPNSLFVHLTIEATRVNQTLNCVGFDPPMDNGPVSVKKNRVLPLKARLLRDGNSDIGILAPPVLQVTFSPVNAPPETVIDVSADAVPVGMGTDGNAFVFSDGEWQFNLKTMNYTNPGTYELKMVSGNTAEYLISPECKAQFVIKEENTR